ncbi:MAG: GntR family transcriptional regulator [Lachnospiraceae bacterium]
MAKATRKYQIIVDWINERIAANELQPKDKLESEFEVASRFGVSRQTVRHAFSILENEGKIESIQGSGSYVRENDPIVYSTEKSRTIMIISTYVNSYIFSSTIQGMEKVLARGGWDIQIVFTHNQFETERNILKKILAGPNMAGLIIEPTMSGLPNPNRTYYDQIIERNIPIVFFNSFYTNMDIPHVSINDVQAGYVAAKYLIDHGHTEIGGIFKADDGQGPRRFSGYYEALCQNGLKLNEKKVIWIDTEEQREFELSKDRILGRLKGCSACICYNDVVAHNLTKLCLQEDIRIPEVLSIVSIDNSELAELNKTPLTSIIHPSKKLGERTAENLIRRIEDPSFDANYEFETKLVERDSVLFL